MPTLHVQRLRFCSQCEEPLSDKCAKCLKHPNRKPRTIELFNFPEVIKTAECGCCVYIQCQRDPCVNKFWRCVTKNYAVGKTQARKVVCKSCAPLTGSDSRKITSVSVQCSCGCGSKVSVQQAKFKVQRYSYVSKKHMYDHRRQETFKDEMAAAFICYGPKCHGEIQDHEWVGGRYKCTACGIVVKAPSTSKINAITPKESTQAHMQVA